MNKKNVAQGFTKEFIDSFRKVPAAIDSPCAGSLRSGRSACGRCTDADPEAKRIMITLAMTYKRLAKFAALRAASA